MLSAAEPLPPEARRFHLRGPLLWRSFDGEWVVMALDSSSLCQLDLVSAAVLGLIEAGPCSPADLAVALAEAAGEAPGSTPDGAWPEALNRALAHLQANDLVVGRNP